MLDVPLAAIGTSREIEEDCFEKGFSYYTSHLNDPMPLEVGLLVGVEFVKDRESKVSAPLFLKQLLNRSLELGLNLIPASAEGISAVRLAPLIISRDQVDSALAILDKALSDYSVGLHAA